MPDKEKDDTGPTGNWTGTIDETKAPEGQAPLGAVIRQIHGQEEQARNNSGGVPLHIEQGPEILKNGGGEETIDPEELSKKPFTPEIEDPVGRPPDGAKDDRGTSLPPFAQEIGDLLGQPPDGSPQEQEDDGTIENNTSWGTNVGSNEFNINTGYTGKM